MTVRFGLYPAALGPEPISTYTRLVADIVRHHEPSTPVPAAPGWTLTDLAVHLTEVQDFWSWIIQHRPSGPADRKQPTNAESPAGSIPTSADEVADALESANAGLVEQLGSAPLLDRAWSWHPELQTVEFTWRRQTHEALIHGFDAVLAAGVPWPDVAPELAADGLDELFTVMAGGVPGWAVYRPSPDRVLVRTTDTGDHWSLEFGTITGRSPGGTDYADEPTLAVVDASLPTGATVAGSALEVDLWAWGRIGDDCVVVSGDASLVGRVRRLVAESTQ
jgi:uncharacterized protein (TIGR03083 family)